MSAVYCQFSLTVGVSQYCHIGGLGWGSSNEAKGHTRHIWSRHGWVYRRGVNGSWDPLAILQLYIIQSTKTAIIGRLPAVEHSEGNISPIDSRGLHLLYEYTFNLKQILTHDWGFSKTKHTLQCLLMSLWCDN